MITLTINNFFAYCSVAWGANILLNFLFIIKKYIPITKNLDKSIDGGFKYGGERLVGDSSTIAGLALSLLFSFILYLTILNSVLFAIPILVYIGHTMGSVIKRRMHKMGGEFVPIVDHGDYIITTGVVFFALNYISFSFFILSIVLTYILHPIVCVLAFKLKLKEYPY